MTGAAASNELSAPVLIVGGGPVGMTLAMALDALGTRCVLVNTEISPRWYPKGSTQNARTMEHYRRLGIAAKLRGLGLPAAYPTDVGYFTRLTGWELARLPMPSEREKMRRVAEAGPTDQVPEPLLRCNQMYVEEFLFQHLKTLDQVTMRFGWQCDDFVVDDSGVAATIEEIETGRRETVRAAYIIGCDGGRGLVRHKLDIRFSGPPLGPQAYLSGPMVLTYVRAPGFRERIPHPPCWQYWIVNHDVRGFAMVLEDSDDLLFGTNLPGPDDKPDAEFVSRRFRLAFGADLPVEFLGHRPWTAGQALVADRFGAGRVWLAGDAAHLFTPTGGFGLNTGVDDAMNIAWKLAACARGWGGPALLASYEVERRPIALRNTAAAKQLARNVGAVPVGEAINEATAAGEAARRAASDVLATFGEEFASLGVQLGARYDGSPIIASDGAAPPPDDPIAYQPSSVPGGRAPHLWLAEHRSLYDQLGQGFTLLSFSGNGADTRPLESAAAARGVPLKTLAPQHPPGRELYGCDFALIRPDYYVAWRGNRLPEDCAALLARVTGW
jgi:2-polyprenyl-6-methoxyphenol hydroxylase-like FAD-dependent oxidoreductase